MLIHHYTRVIFLISDREKFGWGLPGGAVVKGAVLSESLGSRPGAVVTGRDREVRGATHNWPSVVRVREGLVGRDLIAHQRLLWRAGRSARQPRLPGARCSLRHIGAAGFRVGCALC